MGQKTAYHHKNLRNALLLAGEKLLRQKGVTGLSLRNLAKAAGVSHSAPYRHFRNKSALLCALAQTGFERLAAAMAEAGEKYPDDPRRQLREAGISYVILAKRHPETTRLMFGGAIEADDIDQKLRETGQKAYQGLLQIVANGRKAGIFQARETEELALAAWSMVHGLAMLITAGHLKEAAETEEQIIGLAALVDDILQSGILKQADGMTGTQRM